ncbi:hypothetical protein LDENG_00264050 [Lucifuga dentata]|nr:hypothetical protein LDENG_00264050 [Lucifuga dentata]
MSQTDLLIIYEAEAEQWARYLHSVFTGPIPDAGICCYDIATVSTRRDNFLMLAKYKCKLLILSKGTRRDNFLMLAKYKCKLLILSKGMLEDLSQLHRFFLSRVLCPAAQVVVLLCGVDSLAPLLELVPLNSDECLQISSEQDADEYLTAVSDVVRKGATATAANVKPMTSRSTVSEQKLEQMQSTGAHSVRSSIVVVPCRVLCRSSTEVFILLIDEMAGNDTEIEFSNDSQIVRVKPVRWNELMLSVNAPDFPAGNVNVTLYSDGVPLSKAMLQYYSTMEEIAYLLSRVADPVNFMCQALQVSSLEMLDQKLSSMLLERMPTGGFQGLHCENTNKKERHHADVPSLLHFAAQYGFKSISSILLQCPGAEQALRTANHNGQIPTEIAKSHGHVELHILLKETLTMFDSGEDNGDASVYEMMCTAGNLSTTCVPKEQREEDEEEEEEDPYALLGVSDECDTVLTSTNAVIIANRPPAPAPRPESSQIKEDQTPYIAQVFQKKKQQSDTDNMYSLPRKQVRGSEDSISSTYDTFVPNQSPELQQLTKLQQKVKSGSLAVDRALERFSDWQQVQKGINTIQQEKLLQQRGGIINNDDSNYDKINIVHHTPSVTVNERRRGSQPVESDFYSKPLKGQQVSL